MQITVDADSYIRHVVANWPGSSYDSRIMRVSSMYDFFENNNQQGHFLGDSGYMLRPWLLAPFPQAANQHQEGYNR